MCGISKDELRRTYKRLAISSNDLGSALAFTGQIVARDLYAISDPDLDYLFIGLSTAMIVAYARPFSRNNPGATYDATRSLSEAFVRSVLTEPAEVDLHAKVIALRDRQFAHSDADEFNLEVALTPGGSQWRHNFVTRPLPHAEFELLRTCIDKLLRGIRRKQDEIQAKLPTNDRF